MGSLGLVTYPFFHNACSRMSGYTALKPELPREEKACIEPRAVMLENHKELLEQWMTATVRNGVRNYKAKDMRSYVISLEGTCMRCHGDKAAFCDRCHHYLAVSADTCWNCHINPVKTAREG